MNCYGPLSKFYDKLTKDVCYSDFIEIYKTEFAEEGGEFRLILDLCCGTGTLTNLMSDEGYDMIAVDSSEDMLMEAQQKCPNALFLCQDAAKLDLYGTVDACISSLDSINYIPKSELNEVMSRLKLFIRPNGLFIFDIREKDWLEKMDGYTSVDESDDYLCLWRADFENNSLIYGMDLFSKQGKLWKREKEEHIEYAYTISELKDILDSAGFRFIKSINYQDRLFVVTKNEKA